MERISSVNSLEGFDDLLKSLRGQCGSRPDCRDANKEANGNSHRDDLAGANLVNVESKARPINSFLLEARPAGLQSHESFDTVRRPRLLSSFAETPPHTPRQLVTWQVFFLALP